MSRTSPHTSQNPDGFCLATLIALVEEGPLWPGAVPSSQGRDRLVQSGFAFFTVCKGQEGFTAVSQEGKKLYMSYFGGSTLAESIRLRTHRAMKNSPSVA